MDWDLADNIGEWLDEKIRKHVERLDSMSTDGVLEVIEGGYNVIGDDPNFLKADEVEFYYRIKVKE